MGKKKYNQFCRKYDLPVIGDRFNMLEAVGLPYKSGNPARWFVQFRCDCSTVKDIESSKVVSGRLLSCGCMRKDNRHAIKHGLEGTRIYRVYRGMLHRCHDPKSINYGRYGAAGIKVCDEWRNDIHAFVNFALNNGYDDSKVIDRIDNFAGYFPGNIRFVTVAENNNNKSNVRKFSVFGETKSLWYWSKDKRCAVSLETLRSRIDNGWGIEKSITTPKIKTPTKVSEATARAIKKELANGVMSKLIAKKHGVSVQCVCSINKGRSWAHI